LKVTPKTVTGAMTVKHVPGGARVGRAEGIFHGLIYLSVIFNRLIASIGYWLLVIGY
jgi:hypothetical protein